MNLVKRHQDESLSHFIDRARKASGLSQRRLCELTNMHLNSYQRIERGDTTSLMSPHAAPLAKALRVSIYDLLGISPSSPIEVVDIKEDKLPLLDYKEAAKLADKKVKLSDLSPIRLIQYSGEHSEMAFAVRILDDSMIPDFKEGDLVIIDPAKNSDIKPGSFVVAACNDGSAVFRQYVLRGRENGKDTFDLHPLNSTYPKLQDQRDGLRIIGLALTYIRDIKK